MSDPVQVTALPSMGMITLRGDLSDGTITQALSDVSGVAMPGLRGAAVAKGQGLLWMSPDEAMLLCDYENTGAKLAALTDALSGVHALCADVSDARVVFAVDGAGAREVLSKLTPADLRPKALPTGELRRTRLAQVAGAIWFESDTEARVICFRSVAGYVENLLRVAAAPEARVAYF